MSRERPTLFLSADTDANNQVQVVFVEYFGTTADQENFYALAHSAVVSQSTLEK